MKYVLVSTYFENPKGFHADDSRGIHSQNVLYPKEELLPKSNDITTIRVIDGNDLVHT